mmetsp:Transcript_114530/g.370202  ORF Transcript_114530/g.370202 Transcript_114530/m.370202 type:complete len:326 (+) Transcript_114530:866-1843(+)
MSIRPEFVKTQSSTSCTPPPPALCVQSRESIGTSSDDCMPEPVLDGNLAAEWTSTQPSKTLSKGEAALQETLVVNKDPSQPSTRKSFTAGLCQAQELHPLMPRIEQGTLVIILLNTVFLGVDLELSVANALQGEAPPAWLEYLDRIFMFAFTFELCLKVCLTRSRFLTGSNWRWNVFDCILVLTSLIEQVTVSLNLTFLRSLRALRAIWAARMLRSISIIQHLRMMVSACVASDMGGTDAQKHQHHPALADDGRRDLELDDLAVVGIDLVADVDLFVRDLHHAGGAPEPRIRRGVASEIGVCAVESLRHLGRFYHHAIQGHIWRH